MHCCIRCSASASATCVQHALPAVCLAAAAVTACAPRVPPWCKLVPEEEHGLLQWQSDGLEEQRELLQAPMLEVVLARQALIHDAHAQREVAASHQGGKLPGCDLTHGHGPT